MILNNFCPVIFSLHHNPVSFVSSNRDIFLYFSPAQKLLIRFCNDSCLLLFFDDVQINDGKGAVNFDSINIFSNVIATDVSLAGQPDFDAQFILDDVVIVNFKFELFTDGMDCDRILSESVFDDSGVIATDAPNEDSSLIVVVKDGILKKKGSQFADDADCLFVRMAFDFTISHRQKALFFDTYGRNDGCATFYKVIQTEDTILHDEFTFLEHNDGILDFAEGDSIYIFVFQLLDLAGFILEDVEDMLMLHKLFFDMVL